MKNISVLGSTGSIGNMTLEIVEKFSYRFSVIGLTAHSNVQKLANQIIKFFPKIVAVDNEYYANELKKLISSVSIKPKILFGKLGYSKVATYESVDLVVNALVGAVGLYPTLAAINAGKDIALANKETLVIAGDIVMDSVVRNKVKLMPIDSEHSAIYQCLLGNNKDDIKEILLTASGGPFWNISKKSFSNITIKKALAHPNWLMGNKITIDSATLMNKALEIIEAKWLFDIPMEKIKVLIHPQSIVHSMVSYNDGSVIAQMSVPDMKLAISYALLYPERINVDVDKLDFFSVGNLSFYPPDFDKFPCLKLAKIAIEFAGTMPAVMNASNEIAVEAFINGHIPFTRIYATIETTMNAYSKITTTNNNTTTLEDIIVADSWARRVANNVVNMWNTRKEIL